MSRRVATHPVNFRTRRGKPVSFRAKNSKGPRRKHKTAWNKKFGEAFSACRKSRVKPFTKAFGKCMKKKLKAAKRRSR